MLEEPSSNLHAKVRFGCGAFFSNFGSMPGMFLAPWIPGNGVSIDSQTQSLHASERDETRRQGSNSS